MNAVVPINSNVEAYRASTDAASICKDIVVQTATTIQGRKYVGVEGWQAIAVAHGCAAGARDVERVDGGIRAIGEVRRMSDGAIIAEAEGFVGEDEPTWYGGTMKRWKWGEKRGEKVWYDEVMPKRPDYAIRAMAQTRAISRACRSAFAHVVVMMNAGLATTPAEEVPHEGFDRDTGEIIEHGPTQSHEVARDEPAPITDDQRDLIQTLAPAAGMDTKSICDAYKVTSLKALTFAQAAKLIVRLQEKKSEAKPKPADNPQRCEVLADEIPY